MKFAWKYAVPLCLAVTAGSAQAQFYKLKGATLSASATEEFGTPLTSSPNSVTTQVPSGSGFLSQTVSNQAVNDTSKPGVLVSFGFHPVSWAGIEINYQFAQFDEVYFNTYSSTPTITRSTRVPVAFHETTAAYQFHPKHIKFQPYVNVGGGYIDFLPYLANEQWRGTGLVETGFDIPTKYPHIAVRVQGRALIYRTPNFYNSALSVRQWRVTSEPTVGFVYRF